MPEKKTQRYKRSHLLLRRTVTLTSAVGVMVLLVLLFVIVPAAVTLSPRFCSLCHPKAHTSWAKATHKNTSCAKCHITNAGLSAIGLSQKLGSYAGLTHSGTAYGFAKKPLNSACDVCHRVKRTISPAGDLVIPHQSHTQLRKLPCVDCHHGLVHQNTTIKRNRTSMLGCYSCHDGKKAPNTCSVCHTEKAVPDDHKVAEWLDIHSQRQAVDPLYCEGCHGWVTDYCAECHRRKPRSHLAERWRSKHQAYMVSEHRGGCSQCHGDKCDKCHGKNPFKKL